MHSIVARTVAFQARTALSARVFSALPEYVLLPLPALSPTMETGNLAQWNKAEGDLIQPGDVIAEVETDKAVVDYEAQEEQYLAKILVPEGTKDIAVGATLGVLVEEQGDIAAIQAADASEFGVQAEAGAQTAAAAAPAAAAAAAPPPPPPPAASAPAPAAAARASTGERVFASPLARKLARESGLGDLSPIAGRGPRGRVLGADVSAFIAGGGLSMGGQDVPSIGHTASGADVDPSQMRKIIASKLTESKGTVPHYYLTAEVTLDAVLRTRAEFNAGLGAGDAKLSVNDFVIKAAALAMRKVRLRFCARRVLLRTIAIRPAQCLSTHSPHTYACAPVAFRRSRHANPPPPPPLPARPRSPALLLPPPVPPQVPDANASWLETAGGPILRTYDTVDINVAISTENGLVSPVVLDADVKAMGEISANVRELAAKAQERALSPEDLATGTFTTSNLGMFGVRQFCAIITPPQAMALAVGAGQKKVVPSTDGLSDYEIQTSMAVTASCDHRVIDGAVGAQWLAAFKLYMENPMKMLL